MIKILGSLIVIFAGIGFGFHKAAKEQKRLEQGIAIKRMLYLLQGEIRYGFTPLPEAVLKISTKTEKEYQPFLKKVAKQLETHSEESFAKIWQQTAEQKLKQVIYEPKFYEKNRYEEERKYRLLCAQTQLLFVIVSYCACHKIQASGTYQGREGYCL